ncbi:TIGR00296 family protein [Candidatus Woesearchaeota archaeon]|jgi:uncharacterized protein|nr:TIGR00296 family protein [Candidatus Woesearchaeota archaeon]MBT7368633.1 TIGR00296 family protein [Candidatus Woesearchaeota archaeon]
MLSDDEGKKLISYARNSIKSKFKKDNTNSNIDINGFDSKQGCFVSLHKQGELRGCIGFPEPVLPLKDAIFEAAQSAAFNDPRFSPITESELDEIELEISVLTVPKLIKTKSPEEYLNKIKIGEDGLIIRTNFSSGLLLPQVFTEYNCTPKDALEMLCEKAGLSKDSWKDADSKIFKFQAQIFSE